MTGRPSEKEWQRTVTGLLDTFRWGWVHTFPMKTERGVWMTGTSGTMAKGWVDLLCFRERVLAIEVKGYEASGHKGTTSDAQLDVLERAVAAGCLAWVLRPSDDPAMIGGWLRAPNDAPQRYGW